MKIFGLTGGIASGKSTVAAYLRELGIPVLDADSLYHQLIAPRNGQPSPLAMKIEESFPGTLHADGSLNRPELSKHIFEDEQARRKLNQLTHPAIGHEFQAQLKALGAKGTSTVFYDVPLLYEVGKEAEFSAIVVVWIPAALQLERLMHRNNLSLADAQARLKSQLSLDLKKSRADFVIDNSGTIAQTREEVTRLIKHLTEAQ